MNLDAVLSIVLESLSNDVLRTTTDPRARASLRSVIRILGHLKINAQLSAERSNQGPTQGLPGSMDLESILPLLAAPSSVDEAMEVPHGAFGGAEFHRALENATVRRTDSAPKAGLSVPELDEVLRWELAGLERVQHQMDDLLTPLLADQQPSSAKAGGDDSSDRLAVYLRARLPSCGQLRVTRFALFSAGRSKVTASVELENCEALPPGLVYRQDATFNATGGNSVASEFAVLRRLHALDVKVPQPFLLEPGVEPMGSAFMLMSTARGSAAAEGMHFPPSSTVVRSLAREMGKLHRIPVGEFADAVPLTTPPSREERLAELSSYEEMWSGYGARTSIAMRSSLDWLRRNIDLALVGKPSLVHRDLMFHNVLADGDELTAVLDWEFARIGYPAEDLGWTRPVAEGVVPWEEFMQLYVDAGGPHLSAEQVDYYSVWAAVRLGAMLAYVSALVASGKTRNIEYVCGSFHETHLLLHRLTSLSKRVLRSYGLRTPD